MPDSAPLNADKTEYTLAEWRAEAARRFGNDPMAWAFVCPVCGARATVQQYKDKGASINAAGLSCIGRWMGHDVATEFGTEPNSKGEMSPCNYAGYGLIRLNPIKVQHPEADEPTMVFDFAPERAA